MCAVFPPRRLIEFLLVVYAIQKYGTTSVGEFMQELIEYCNCRIKQDDNEA